MSLSTTLSNLATRIATEFKAVKTLINGNTSDLTGLQTTSKTNLVSAINEVNGVANSASKINDAATNTTTSWSGSKTNTELIGLRNQLLNGAGAALDTLKELGDALGNDANFATTITTALSNKASATDVSNLSNNVGDTSVDLVATFNAGLV